MSRKSDFENEITMWSRRLQLLREKKAQLGISADPSIDLEIEDIENKIDNLDKQLTKLNLSGIETLFYQDLNTLIQQAENDFEGKKGKQDFSDTETGSIAYKSKFSFEYSTLNTIWHQTDGTYYFSCHFYDGPHLQEADAIYTELARRIKLALANEWRFQEQDKPDRISRKELKATRRYNTMRIKLELIVYRSTRCKIDFLIEKLEE
jgi:hypothetical protein